MANITFFFKSFSTLPSSRQVKQILQSFCTEVLQSANIMNWHKLVYTSHFLDDENNQVRKKKLKTSRFTLHYSCAIRAGQRPTKRCSERIARFKNGGSTTTGATSHHQRASRFAKKKKGRNVESNLIVKKPKSQRERERERESERSVCWCCPKIMHHVHNLLVFSALPFPLNFTGG